MTAHSKIGASSMHRWAACPGSVRLSANIENRSSVFAAEGTAAHALAEGCLTYGLDAVTKIGLIVEDFEVTEEMAEAVQVYLDAAQAIRGDDGKMLVEHRFDLSTLHPGLFGTADCVIFNPKTKRLTVMDYKHGQGIPVEVEENPQLMYYGLGALLTAGFKAEEVELVVVQPRCPHKDGPVRRWTLPAIDLLDFAADLIEYARKTEDPDAPLNPGDHCRFCPAAGLPCPAIHAKAQELAAREFAPTLSYNPDLLAETLTWVPVLEAWCKNVREFGYAEAEHGRTPPGWKLAEKVARRKWKDGLDLRQTAAALGLDFLSDFVKEPVPKPIGEIEKLVGKKVFAEKGADFVTKESSGHVLVPETDPRPAIKPTAADDFKGA